MGMVGEAEAVTMDDEGEVEEHLAPALNESNPLNLPPRLQARLLAYVRANNVNIPQGAANIRIFSKEGLPNDGSSCRVFMSGSSSDPGSSAPSTSKISYESKRATAGKEE